MKSIVKQMPNEPDLWRYGSVTRRVYYAVMHRVREGAPERWYRHARQLERGGWDGKHTETNATGAGTAGSSETDLLRCDAQGVGGHICTQVYANQATGEGELE